MAEESHQQRRRSVSVSFRGVVQCKTIRRRGDASELYYRRSELAAIRKQATDTVRKIETGIKIDSVEECTRGLEKFTTRNVNRTAQRRKTALAAVLASQNHRRAQTHNEQAQRLSKESHIAELYAAMTQKSRNEALQRALDDEMDANRIALDDASAKAAALLMGPENRMGSKFHLVSPTNMVPLVLPCS